MPNWCDCDYYVSCDDPVKLKEFLDSLQSAENEHGVVIYKLCDSAVPMPDEIRNTGSPIFQVRYTKTAEKKNAEYAALNEGTGDGACRERYMTLGRRRQLVRKYGADNWYEWCLGHWGSKWGDCDTWLVDSDDYHLTFRFESPWGPPDIALHKLAGLFPALRIRLDYFECGMGYNGYVVWRNGQVWDEMYSENYRGGRGG